MSGDVPYSVMPEGVEHLRLAELRLAELRVPYSVMPEGVEHEAEPPTSACRETCLIP